MFKLSISMTALSLALATATLAQSPADLEPYAVKARAAVKDMSTKLMHELKSALATGGPIAAVSVCNTIAPAIADAQSKAAGLTVRRTALRVRNSANAPDELETKVLKDFAVMLAAGTDPATLEHIEKLSADGKELVRYFRPIPMAKEPCLTCHGSNLSGELKGAIGKLYPNDQATGFKEGELRGMFSVTMEAKP